VPPVPRPQHHHYSHDQLSIAAAYSAASSHIVTALIIQIQISSLLTLTRIQPEYRRDMRYYIAYLFIVNYITFELKKKTFCLFDRLIAVFSFFRGL